MDTLRSIGKQSGESILISKYNCCPRLSVGLWARSLCMHHACMILCLFYVSRIMMQLWYRLNCFRPIFSCGNCVWYSSHLWQDILQSLVQAFIHCRLDYCNALLTHWDSQGPAVKWLQAVQMLQLVWCLYSSPWPCHVTTAQPSLVASGTASYLWNYSPRLEVYPWRCFSLPARAMHSSGQHPWSSQTTVCVNWLHAKVCCTMELWWQWAGSVEQSASNTARQYRVTTHIQVATEKIAICSMVNTIRRCCSVFASLLQPTLAPLYKTLDLLTYIQFTCMAMYANK